MAYEIRHQREAEYHLLQFTGPPALLESLSHNLRIDDAVLRFRIIKVLPGTPPAPDTAPPVVPRRRRRRPSRRRGRQRPVGARSERPTSAAPEATPRPPRPPRPDNVYEHCAGVGSRHMSSSQRFRPFSVDGADCRLSPA